MNKEKIIVPKGIRYISEWDGYRLEDYNYPHILNKVLTGCGFTEYCISNQLNIILVSPRRFLLENKEDQHPGEVYYVRNDIGQIVDYEKNISDENKPIKKQQKTLKFSEDEVKKKVFNLREGIRDYCRELYTSGFKRNPRKILVTYDSFRHVKEVLQEVGLLDKFYVVVDEFQSIFIDSHFKSNTELELLQQLQGIQNICFVSATPMLDKYLDMLDEFKDLPYKELDWVTEDPGRVRKPKLEVKFTRSISEEVNKVIRNYQERKFEVRLDSKIGGFIESHEATLFMNSVKGICQAIRTNKLHLEDCNVLCAKTLDNESDIRRAFNDVLKNELDNKALFKPIPKSTPVIGRIPKRGEKHKQFTFCTRTVYLGADFYSTNSRTFIFSDSNIDCLSVDISMDLEQILGRQRLDINPWKNSANLYIKTTSGKNLQTPEEFKNYLNKKIEDTNKLLDTYNRALDDAKYVVAERYEFIAKNNNYKKDYVAVNKHAGTELIPVFNNLVLVSEMRAFEIQQIDYKDRFTVFNALGDTCINISDKVYKAVEIFDGIKISKEKFRFLVKFADETPGVTKEDINNFLSLIPDKYGEIYRLLGPDRIKANSYQESRIKEEWLKMHTDTKVDNDMITEIYNTFKVGEKYSKASIKSTLKSIYEKFEFDKTAKASDLGEYFVLKTTSAKENSKWVHGFEILSKI